MKKILSMAGLSLIIISGCTQKQESVKLEPDSPAYTLAKDLAQKVPALDPDENRVIVKTSEFDVTSGEAVQMIYTRVGKQQNGIKNQSAEQLRQIMVSNAERLGEQKLLLSAASDENITVSITELDSVLQMRYKRYRGEENFKKSLEQAGISFETMKNELHEGLIIRKYLEENVGNKDDITDEEIQKAFEKEYSGDRKASVQHILLMTQGKPDAEKEKIKLKMEDILAKARGGEDFGELAKQYSEDPGSKDKGGLYENFERGTMVKPFEDAAFNLSIGSISDVVETQYGYHILKIIDRKKDDRTLEQLRGNIVENLRRQKIDTYIKEMKEKVDFEVVGLF